MCGLSAQATDWYKEAVPPVLIRESRPKPATLDVDIADTEEGLLRLVGSFTKARLFLGEVAENLCVRRRIAGVGYSASDSSAGLHAGGV